MSEMRILIIWDNTDFTKMFTLFFEQSGYVADSAHSFEEGFTLCLHQPPDILIIPRTIVTQDDGLAFCQQIRATPALSHIPIIVGYADLTRSRLKPLDAYQQVHEVGANACFGRVFDITDVLEEVEILMDNPTATHLVDRQTLWMSQRKTNDI